MILTEKKTCVRKQGGRFFLFLRLFFLSVFTVCIMHAAVAFGMETEGMTEVGPDRETEEAELVSGQDTSCTIFIYMCGSNLESKYGLASVNIDELLEADIPEQTNVIIETGGASRWWSSEWIEEDKLQRYIVRDHHLELLMEMDNMSMGDGFTFYDFLRWGQENYWADRNILVLWDHGGSSADGVCYDESHGYDSLKLKELKDAFDIALLPGRFDLVCLDTCYMGSLATASLFSDYARYMTASQTIVPGPGMDYKVLSEEAAGSDLKEFGKILCDAFMTKNSDTGKSEEAQIAFYDLDAAKDLTDAVDQGAVTLKKVYEKTGDSFGLLAAAHLAKVDGSGIKANVIDLMEFVNAITLLDWSDNRKEIQSLLNDLVLYQAHGAYVHMNGVSIYYPLNYNENQLADYERITPARNYSALLHEIYSDLPEVMITFKDPGSIGQEGTFDMDMTEESRPYLRSVVLRTWKESKAIPGTFSLLGDSELNTYMTNLGRKLSDLHVSTLPDGKAYALDSHFLLLSVYPSARTQLYSAPVSVNGEDTTYDFVMAESLYKSRRRILYTMLGNLFDENGLVSRNFEHLKIGDRIAVYEALDEAGENLVLQDEFTIEDESIEPERIPLPEGTYRCQYIVTDILGKKTGSDYCIYQITEEDGERKVELKEIKPAAAY